MAAIGGASQRIDTFLTSVNHDKQKTAMPVDSLTRFPVTTACDRHFPAHAADGTRP
jgi:hypothetical protein